MLNKEELKALDQLVLESAEEELIAIMNVRIHGELCARALIRQHTLMCVCLIALVFSVMLMSTFSIFCVCALPSVSLPVLSLFLSATRRNYMSISDVAG